jgi:Bacterial Ig-like domain/Calcineurin-like phosphoesterase
MKSMKLGVWVLVGMGLAMVLSVGFLVPEGSVSAQVSADPVFVGAGDIASCGRTGDEATAKLLHNIVDDPAAPPTTVFTTGDNAYEDGKLSEYEDCYRPNWGQFKTRTMPSPGNHEYQTPGASGYFDYFSATPSPPVPNPGLTPGKGYYSYNLGSWHIISLNSNCSFVETSTSGGGCAAGSDQVTWLKDDLAANSYTKCTLAYWHHPLFSSGSLSGGNSNMKPFWDALYAAKADVVLNGHVHNYERFAPQDSNGELPADPERGIREFVVGTGGYSKNAFKTIVANSVKESRNADAFGVLKLTLHPNGYDWEFVPEAGKTFTDSGSDSCEPDGTTPTDPVPGPPTVISTSPANNTTGIATDPVTATFSEPMDENTITATTFKLVKLNSDGTTTKVTDTTVTYDTATKKAILDPTSDLSTGQTYKATVTTGAQDSAGNALDQKPNIAGNQSKSWKFTVR